MDKFDTIGIDSSKRSAQLHGATTGGASVVRK